MADQTQLDLLKAGVEGWNAWREANPGVEVDLRGATLHGANLRGANLRGAILRFALLGGANLSGADFSGANLDWAIRP